MNFSEIDNLPEKEQAEALRNEILLKLGYNLDNPITYDTFPTLTLDWIFHLEHYIHGNSVDIFGKHLKNIVQNTYTGTRTSEFTSFIEDQIWHASAIQRAKAWLLTIEEDPDILHFTKAGGIFD